MTDRVLEDILWCHTIFGPCDKYNWCRGRSTTFPLLSCNCRLESGRGEFWRERYLISDHLKRRGREVLIQVNRSKATSRWAWLLPGQMAQQSVEELKIGLTQFSLGQTTRLHISTPPWQRHCLQPSCQVSPSSRMNPSFPKQLLAWFRSDGTIVVSSENRPVDKQ